MRFRIEFDLRSLWVGIFWKHEAYAFDDGTRKFSASTFDAFMELSDSLRVFRAPQRRVDVYLCFVPTVLLHFVFWGRKVTVSP